MRKVFALPAHTNPMAHRLYEAMRRRAVIIADRRTCAAFSHIAGLGRFAFSPTPYRVSVASA
jgi:hypothetical protein